MHLNQFEVVDIILTVNWSSILLWLLTEPSNTIIITITRIVQKSKNDLRHNMSTEVLS